MRRTGKARYPSEMGPTASLMAGQGPSGRAADAGCKRRGRVGMRAACDDMLKNLHDATIHMIHAEISIYPMATKDASVGFYIAKAIESIRDMDGLRYEINPMGTVLESEGMGAIHEATDRMMEVVHNLGVGRVEVVLKIDSRRDRDTSMEGKVESVRRHMR